MVIRGFFDHIDHEWAVSGQWSVSSPVIANIYMHYVLLWWFKEKVQPGLRGYADILVFI